MKKVMKRLTDHTFGLYYYY